MKDIGRLLTAMVTPFDAQGQVDYAQAKRLAQALIDSGSEGLVITGTTGESPTLSNEEKLKMYAAAKEAVGDSSGRHRRHHHLQHRGEHSAHDGSGPAGHGRLSVHGALLQ